MVTKKTPEKKSPVRKSIMIDAPVRTTSRIKSSDSHNAYSYSFIIFLTVISMLAIEAIFGLPSRWLHGDMMSDHDMGGARTMDKMEKNICTKEYIPVCGSDGKTYPNKCTLERAGVSLVSNGDCPKDLSMGVPPTGTSSGTPIDENVAVNTPLPGDPQTESPLVEPSNTLDTSKGWTYDSKVFGYSLKVPRFAYYTVYRSADGKGDIIGIDKTKRESESATQSLVRVTYTKTGDTPPTDTKKSVNVANGTLSLSYSEPLSKQGQEIVDYIVATAK